MTTYEAPRSISTTTPSTTTTVTLGLGVCGAFSSQASRIEETTDFKRALVESFARFAVPQTVAVEGLGPNRNEEGALASHLAQLEPLVSQGIQPVMDGTDFCYYDPATDRWAKERLFRLYESREGRFISLGNAVDRWAEKNPGAPAEVLHELRQVSMTLFARWTTEL